MGPLFPLDGYPSKGGLVKAVLSKWGNCRAVRIPSEVCALLGVDAGSDLGTEVVR